MQLKRRALRTVLGIWRPAFPRQLGLYDVLIYPFTGTLEWMRRHALLIGELERFRGGRDRLEVLDFGGGIGALAQALTLYGREHAYRVTTADIDPSAEIVIDPEGGLPLPDDSFDVVVSSDVFEHIDPIARGRWAAELRRVARLGQAHTFPADGRDLWKSTLIDGKLDAWHRTEFGVPDRWTSEHLAGIEPTVDEMLRHFPGARLTGFANADVWLAMMQNQLGRPGPLGRLQFGLHYLLTMRRRDRAAPWKAALLVVATEPGGDRSADAAEGARARRKRSQTRPPRRSRKLAP